MGEPEQESGGSLKEKWENNDDDKASDMDTTEAEDHSQKSVKGDDGKNDGGIANKEGNPVEEEGRDSEEDVEEEEEEEGGDGAASNEEDVEDEEEVEEEEEEEEEEDESEDEGEKVQGHSGDEDEQGVEEEEEEEDEEEGEEEDEEGDGNVSEEEQGASDDEEQEDEEEEIDIEGGEAEEKEADDDDGEESDGKSVAEEEEEEKEVEEEEEEDVEEEEECDDEADEQCQEEVEEEEEEVEDEELDEEEEEEEEEEKGEEANTQEEENENDVDHVIENRPIKAKKNPEGEITDQEEGKQSTEMKENTPSEQEQDISDEGRMKVIADSKTVVEGSASPEEKNGTNVSEQEVALEDYSGHDEGGSSFDSPPESRQKRGAQSADMETGAVDTEDFPTDNLLKELHFLNASCEKPSVCKPSNIPTLKTPKKQKKLEFPPRVNEESSMQDEKDESVTRRVSKRKRKPISYNISDKRRKKSPSASKPKGQNQEENEEEQEKNQEKDWFESINRDSDDDDGCGLTIVAQEEQPKKRKASPQKRPKKRMRTDDEGHVPQEVIELIQSGIDEVLEEKAERTHLTANHVKNIIKNVMTDENVLAMVRNTVLGLQEADATAVYEPTLTRAKTKELMKQKGAISTVNIWAGLSNSSERVKPAVYHETRALATTEFPEEDEDEEYRPDADEQLHSDDESFISTGFGSDMGSPYTPSTPQSQYTSGSRSCVNTPTSSCMSTPIDQHVQPFKAPTLQQKAVQRALTFDSAASNKEELVSQRTRSKLPLTETPLECLEMAFKPPDVTKDMYGTVVDDEEWKRFLIDFIHPLNNVEGNEDEEADPEYNILEDKEDDLDLREEMRGDRAVQISKKEINELMTELLDTLVDNGKNAPVRAHLSQQFRYKEKKCEPSIPKPDHQKDNIEVPSPGAIWVEVLTAKFTPKQLETLKCQMTQHVQLLLTSWLLCSGYSAMENVAKDYLNILKEVKKYEETSEYSNTYFRTVNLDPALETIEAVKKKAENQKIPNQERKKVTELNKFVIDCILESKGFPYPKLLPTRMLHLPGPATKAKFAPSEDALIAIGFERYLDPKHRSTDVGRRSTKMIEAIGHTVQNIVIAKTADQVFNRIMNIKRKTPEDQAPNVIYEYLGTGVLNIPEAEPEPLLPCVPCPVYDYPGDCVEGLWQKLIKDKKKHILSLKHQEVLREKAARAKAEAEKAKMRPQPPPVQNILIIQSPNGSTQLIIPNNMGPIVTQPNIVLPPNNIAPAIIQPTTAPTTAFLPISNQPLVLNMMEDATPVTTIQTSGTQNVQCVPSMGMNSALTVMPLSNESMAAASTTASEVVGTTPTMTSVQTTESTATAIITPFTEQENDIHCQSNDPLQEQNTECQDEDRPPLTENNGEEKDRGAEGSDGESLPDLIGEDNIQANFEASSATCKSSDVESQSCTDSQGNKNITSTLKTTLCTPLKMNPTNTTSVPTPLLHMPSLLATPQKVDEKGPAAVCVSFSPLKTPVISIPTPDKSLSTPEKNLAEFITPAFILDGPLQSKSHVKSLESSLSDSNSVISSVENTSAVSPTKSVSSAGSENIEIQGLENQNKSNVSAPHINQSPQNISEKEAECGNTTPPKANSITLVTSVYQSPILSSEVRDPTGSITVMNLTPKKSKPALRRISPAKILRSPMKTSPMKQVSPILRKYHRYSPKKRRNLPSSKKLSPILPKILPPRKRTLKPKPVKTPPLVQESVNTRGKNKKSSGSQSYLHSEQRQSDGDLVQMEDEMVLEADTGSEAVGEAASDSASDTGQSKADEVQQSEEEFEEDYLEEEEEEEEEAAQEREEHLAALLKASSTIAWRRGGCDASERKLSGGGDVPGERRLNKQQRRLQARITALSSVPDTVTQDKFMAQSYLMRVREALTGKDPSLFREFLYILNEFTENQTSTPLELYGQLCELLKDFPHLTEEFVSFLLPQQAMAIGKYAQYCAIHRMRDFLEKLELQFRKQPQYIQKIIRMLQSLQNRPDFEIEDVKAAMAPLLRYPHLVECFMQCFPSQAPAPSLPSDFEDVSLDQPGTPDSAENMVLPDDELNTSPDHCVCPCHVSDTRTTATATAQHGSSGSACNDHCQSCAIRFSEGRVYLQYGKTLRPARVTYCNGDSKEEKDSEAKEGGRSQGGGGGPQNDVETGSRVKSGVARKSKDTTNSESSSTMRNREGLSQVESKDKSGSNHGDKREYIDRRRHDESADLMSEDVSSRRQEYTYSRKDNSDGKSAQPKRSSNAKERSEKSDGGSGFAGVGFEKSSAQGKSNAGRSSQKTNNKKPSFLVCSPPKEVHNENAVLPSCPRTKNLQNFSSVGELLAPHVVEERQRHNSNTSGEEEPMEFSPRSQNVSQDIPSTPLTKSLIAKESQNLTHLSKASTVCSPRRSTYSENTSSSSLSSSVCTSGMEITPSTILAKDLELSSSLSLPATTLGSRSVGSSNADIIPPQVQWSKEEDMRILSLVQLKGATTAAFQEIARQIPGKTCSEVQERFNALMKLMMEEAGMDDSISISSEDSYA
ncbi:GON-4-like protein [Penaeus indicus]|uniref:GON-4-like protein n=1 Tax=Penaeus indicus TaxID=29960 RepID=UPI00300D3D36